MTNKKSLNYKNVLKHFQRQAEGKSKRQARSGNLIVIGIDKHVPKNKLKMEIVVPAEAAIRRARSELIEDIKGSEKRGSSQSLSSPRRSNKTLNKRKITEAKDIFTKKWQI